MSTSRSWQARNRRLAVGSRGPAVEVFSEQLASASSAAEIDGYVKCLQTYATIPLLRALPEDTGDYQGVVKRRLTLAERKRLLRSLDR